MIQIEFKVVVKHEQKLQKYKEFLQIAHDDPKILGEYPTARKRIAKILRDMEKLLCKKKGIDNDTGLEWVLWRDMWGGHLVAQIILPSGIPDMDACTIPKVNDRELHYIRPLYFTGSQSNDFIPMYYLWDRKFDWESWMETKDKSEPLLYKPSTLLHDLNKTPPNVDIYFRYKYRTMEFMMENVKILANAVMDILMERGFERK